MPRRCRAAWLTILLLPLFAGPGRAASFVDSAERYVVLPDRVGRVMAANQSAAVLVFVLAPEKLAGCTAFGFSKVLMALIAPAVRICPLTPCAAIPVNLIAKAVDSCGLRLVRAT